MNPFLIAYFVFLVGFILGVAAVLYHIVKYQLNRKSMLLTAFIFLTGAFILLLINIVIAVQVDWADYRITF